METLPLVSVIINTRNRPALILRAVQSVLTQDYPNFELLLVDASTNEETREIAESLNDQRLKYHRITDEEYFAKTFFFAISIAEGAYIAFNDDDDEWISEKKLSKQVALIESLPDDYGVVYCWWEMWYDDVNKLIAINRKSNRGYLFEKMLYGNAALGTPALLIKRDLLCEVKDLMDSPDILPSDHFLLTYISKKYRFDFVPEVMVRCHERHVYGSMNKTICTRFSHKHRINLQLLFLNTFSEDYLKMPKARKKKYEIIIFHSIKSLEAKTFIIYILRHLNEFRDFRFFLKAYLNLFLQ